MDTRLKQYFPLIRTKNELLGVIYSDAHLKAQYDKWEESQQREFVDSLTGVKGIKILYDSFFKEIMNPESTPERLEEFLSLLLRRKVHILHVLTGDSTRLGDETSLVYTDIIVELEDGTIANIEIQRIGYLFPGQRAACYEADMLLRQYKRARSTAKAKGENFSYKDIKDVYLIVLYEKSPKEFKAYPEQYIHHASPVFDTGLKMELLQHLICIPLDIFKKHIQNGISNKLEAWLAFLCMDDADTVITLTKQYPEFKPMYEQLYAMCRNVEGVMGLFSEELKILDKNTMSLMIDQMHEEVEKLQEEKQSLQEEKQSLQEEKQSLQEEKQSLQEEKQNLQEEKHNLQEENHKMEAEIEEAVLKKQKAEEERQKAEEEKYKAEKEKQRAEQETRKMQEQIKELKRLLAEREK